LAATADARSVDGNTQRRACRLAYFGIPQFRHESPYRFTCVTWLEHSLAQVRRYLRDTRKFCNAAAQHAAGISTLTG
jgi:hypothetical protein